MATIDSDAHVVEGEETWSYIERSARDFTPVQVAVPDVDGRTQNFWVIDGRLVRTGPVSETDAAKAVRELTDVDGRLRQWTSSGPTSR